MFDDAIMYIHPSATGEQALRWAIIFFSEEDLWDYAEVHQPLQKQEDGSLWFELWLATRGGGDVTIMGVTVRTTNEVAPDDFRIDY